jgi:hypothetical protein
MRVLSGSAGHFGAPAVRDPARELRSDACACQASFDVYGFRFSVCAAEPDLIKGLRQDFEYFAVEDAGETGVVIELIDSAPPLEGLPQVPASVYTPRNVVYHTPLRRYIDYHGRALGIREESTARFTLYSHDRDLLYEAAYLYVLSEAGRRLDQSRLHRIHALGVAVNNRAALVLLPMGGGKSTLALHLMKYPDVRLLSDDSPYIRRDGHVLAYPLRLGLLPGSEKDIPEEHRRLINRMEFGPKHLVDYSYFKDRVQPSAPPGVVFIGARTMERGCRVELARRPEALRACIANCVVGVGLFQGLEFILQASGWELLRKTGVGLSRLRNCAALVRRSRVCRIYLGSDPVENARTLAEYCRTL